MRLVLATLLFVLALSPAFLSHARGASREDEFAVVLERLRKENPGEYEKVVELTKTDRTSGEPIP